MFQFCSTADDSWAVEAGLVTGSMSKLVKERGVVRVRCLERMDCGGARRYMRERRSPAQHPLHPGYLQHAPHALPVGGETQRGRPLLSEIS